MNSHKKFYQLTTFCSLNLFEHKNQSFYLIYSYVQVFSHSKITLDGNIVPLLFPPFHLKQKILNIEKWLIIKYSRIKSNLTFWKCAKYSKMLKST